MSCRPTKTNKNQHTQLQDFLKCWFHVRQNDTFWCRAVSCKSCNSRDQLLHQRRTYFQPYRYSDSCCVCVYTSACEAQSSKWNCAAGGESPLIWTMSAGGSVCLSANRIRPKCLKQISMKFGRQFVLMLRNNWLDFYSYLKLGFRCV